MKALSIIILLVGFVGIQSMSQASRKKSNYPYHTISKEVQKLPFRNVDHLPAKIVLTEAITFSAKGSARILASSKSEAERAVTRRGYPSWTISKGVARQQYERSVKQ